MPLEGALNPAITERSETSGEAPAALPLEGALNPAITERSETSGEAPAALPLEGALNPNNCGGEDERDD